MPFIRLEGGSFDDDPDNLTNTDSFEYHSAEETAYKPQPFDPDALIGATAAVYGILRQSGLTRFCVRYDGGHDEGFAHADGGWTAEGVYRPIDAIAEELAIPKNVEMLRAAFAEQSTRRHHSIVEHYAKLSSADFVKRMLDELSDQMATCLLGKSYGTGEYSMYGEFTADLTDGSLIDNEAAVQPPDVSFD